MPKTCKIEALGLSEEVQRLMSDGVTTRAAVTERLKNDHQVEISEATVGRYIARVRSSAEAAAYRTITEHVNRTVPEDLAALEEMEATSLAWSREAASDRVERLACISEQITGELALWAEKISSAQEEGKQDTATRWVIKRALSLMAMDDRRQEQRLAAMRQVHKIIETKLSKAGLLDDDQKGRIVFLQRQAAGEGSVEDGSEQRPGHRRLHLVGDQAQPHTSPPQPGGES